MTRDDPEASTILAQRRLDVLKLARELGNTAEACRRLGFDRTSFYEWKRRFEERGFEGLKDLPPTYKDRRHATQEAEVERIRELALLHPAYGCNWLEAELALEDITVSAVTIQKILTSGGLGKRNDRWLALEAKNAERTIEISAEQVAFLEKLNPCFRERKIESAAPGERLSADTFFVGSLKEGGKVYLYAVVDTYSSYAFGCLQVSKEKENKYAHIAVVLLDKDVLPFYKDFDLPVQSIHTDNGIEFRGIKDHEFVSYIKDRDIKHLEKTEKIQNGFIERFKLTVFEEFFKVQPHKNIFYNFKEIQESFKAWLVHYNTERPHLGYRNMGLRPIESITAFLNSR